MMGCYRSGEAHDPETYVSAVAAVLIHYPEWVVQAVTDPNRGIPGKLKWLPSVAEVKAACDEEMRPYEEADARRRREEESFRRLHAPADLATPEQRARAVQHWEDEVRPEIKPAEAKEPLHLVEERLGRHYRNRETPIPLSDRLLKKIAEDKALGLFDKKDAAE